MTDENVSRQYTEEQLFALFEQWSLYYKPQATEEEDEYHLPVEVSNILETTPTHQLKENFKKFKRELRRYRHDEWTTSKEINKQFIPKLKKHTVETLQVVNTIYKHSENTRTMARAATELYEQLQYIQTAASTINPMELATIQSECREAAKRLAVYGWVSARTQDNQATEYAAKAIKVPQNISLDYLPEEGTKRQAFSKEFVMEYNQVSHQNSLSRAAINNKPAGNGSRYGNGSRGRGVFSSYGRPFLRGRPGFATTSDSNNRPHNTNHSHPQSDQQ
ncbi:hypothetical protein G6F43_010581 [Rhizopus delemar]|nr:hypothetical protein G6F43_010581 [Rhizopus delemar]